MRWGEDPRKPRWNWDMVVVIVLMLVLGYLFAYAATRL